MSGFNRVVLMGNLTRDPEVRYTPSNYAICKFGIAVNNRRKDAQTGDWKEDPVFVDVTIFGARGEAFCKHHSKGRPTLIEGRLALDQWEDRATGAKRTKLYVIADSWEFVGGGKADREDGTAPLRMLDDQFPPSRDADEPF